MNENEHGGGKRGGVVILFPRKPATDAQVVRKPLLMQDGILQQTDALLAFFNGHVHGLNKKTQEWYIGSLNRAARRLGMNPEQATTMEINALFRELFQTNPGGAENMYRALNTYYLFLIQNGHIISNPMRDIRRKENSMRKQIRRHAKNRRKMVQRLQEAEIERLLACCRRKKLKNALRDATIILLLYTTGIRAGELANLKVTDMRLIGKNKWIRVDGKSGKRRVPISDNMAEALLTYLAAANPRDFVFLTENGKPFTHRSLRDLLDRLCARAGCRHVHPHLFRHTFATEFLLNGGDPFTCMEILGHSCLETTLVYFYATKNDLQKSHRKFAPGRKLKVK